MTNILIQSPFEFLTDKSGEPLSNGYIYIGEPGKDPQEFPLAVFFDADGIVAAPDPLRTNTAGYPTDGAGNPQRIFTTGPYSIRVRDKNSAQVYYSANSSDGFFGVVAADLASATGALLVGYRSQTVYSKLGQLGVSPQDYGAVADGVNNDQAAVESAVATGAPVFLPPGEYNAPSGDFTGTVFYSFGGASANNSTISIIDVTSNAFPVGAVMTFPCEPSALPEGFVPLDGSVLNRTVYAALWSFANSSGNIVAEVDWATSKMAFSSGNGSSTFRVPDARGIAVAGADNGAGVDAAFALGDVVERVVTDGTEPATTTFRYGPQTVAIRAFSGSVNPGLIDITALGNQVNDIQTDVVDLQADVAALAITKMWESAELTITPAGTLTIAHTLGEEPKFWVGFLVCKVDEAGFTAGQEIPAPVFQVGDSGSYGPVTDPDATQFVIRYGSSGGGFTVTNFTTGGLANITAANWRYKLRAFA